MISKKLIKFNSPMKMHSKLSKNSFTKTKFSSLWKELPPTPCVAIPIMLLNFLKNMVSSSWCRADWLLNCEHFEWPGHERTSEDLQFVANLSPVIFEGRVCGRKWYSGRNAQREWAGRFAVREGADLIINLMFSMINIIKIINNEWGRVIDFGRINEESTWDECQFG